MQQLSQYFDAMRVDHILGFFRIWQVPLNQVQGTLGLFNPRLPFTAEELANFGISGDLSLFTKPFINDELLDLLFGNQKNEVTKVFFLILLSYGRLFSSIYMRNLVAITIFFFFTSLHNNVTLNQSSIEDYIIPQEGKCDTNAYFMMFLYTKLVHFVT
jgi:succinate dehydrogenase hydrophobic anchor subunit